MKISASYWMLLADTSVDAVSITTHVPDHRAIAALRAGEHVLLEKPMAPTVQECDLIVQAAQSSQTNEVVTL